MFAGPPRGAEVAWINNRGGVNYSVKNEEPDDYTSIAPVAGHTMIKYEGSLVVWGGYHMLEDGSCEYRSPTHIYIYPASLDLSPRKWIVFTANTGDVPPPTSGSCGILWTHFMLIFGGYVSFEVRGSLACHLSDVYMLNLISGQWNAVKCADDEFIPSPRDKAAGWVSRNICYFFGGYGPHPSRLARSERYLYDEAIAQYMLDESAEGGRFWNNQLVAFSPQNECKKWKLIRTSGTIPSPRAAAASVLLPSKNCALVFGGRSGSNRLNDLYLLDMETMIWTNVNVGIRPGCRSWCSMACLDESTVVIQGGLSNEDCVLSDWWRLKLYPEGCSKFGGDWHEIKCKDEQDHCRLWHTGAVVEGLYFLIGGSNIPLSEAMTLCKTSQLRLLTPSLLFSCYGAVTCNMLDVTWLPSSIQRHLKWRNYLESISDQNLEQVPEFLHLSLGDILRLSALR
ncbi:hypothetical protein AB6A40_001015 [Gnathostoma spinigerum]|uniref:Uncharacterized protein n=1 Tax=Gnathostoma spinigerum TaxID=75299 RepID=A0ABD6EA60_9BILA